MSGILLYHSLSYSFETGSFTEPQTKWAASKPQNSSCFCPSLVLELTLSGHAWLYHVGAVDLSSHLMPTEPSSPGPRYSFRINHLSFWEGKIFHLIYFSLS